MLNASFPELKQTLLTFFFVGTFEIRLDYEQSLFFLGPSSKTPETRKLLNLKKKRDSSQSKIRQFPKPKKVHSSGTNSGDNRTSAMKDLMVPCDL